MTPVGFEPTPFRNGALSHRLRPLGQSVHAIPSEVKVQEQHSDRYCSLPLFQAKLRLLRLLAQECIPDFKMKVLPRTINGPTRA